MRDYITDKDVDDLMGELFNDKVKTQSSKCYSRSRCREEEDSYMDFHFPTEEILQNMKRDIPGTDEYMFDQLYAFISKINPDSMGAEFLLSQDPWDLD